MPGVMLCLITGSIQNSKVDSRGTEANGAGARYVCCECINNLFMHAYSHFYSVLQNVLNVNSPKISLPPTTSVGFHV